MREISFYSNNISEIIDITKELGENCNCLSPTPYGIKKQKFEVEIFDSKNQLIFNGYFFENFREFVKILHKIQNGIIRYSCNIQPY